MALDVARQHVQPGRPDRQAPARRRPAIPSAVRSTQLAPSNSSSSGLHVLVPFEGNSGPHHQLAGNPR